MCGRYQISMEEEIVEMREIFREINERYKDTLQRQAMKTGEVFPADIAPVLVSGENKPQAALMTWGFPKWQGRGIIINARAETAEEKKSFRLPLNRRRCVVPATGFYEWRHDGNTKKSKYLFRLSGLKPLYLAGIYDQFQAESAAYYAYVILTTAANPSVAAYHDRMPLILHMDQISAWLSDAGFARTFLQTPSDAALDASPA